MYYHYYQYYHPHATIWRWVCGCGSRLRDFWSFKPFASLSAGSRVSGILIFKIWDSRIFWPLHRAPGLELRVQGTDLGCRNPGGVLHTRSPRSMSKMTSPQSCIRFAPELRRISHLAFRNIRISQLRFWFRVVEGLRLGGKRPAHRLRPRRYFGSWASCASPATPSQQLQPWVPWCLVDCRTDRRFICMIEN